MPRIMKTLNNISRCQSQYRRILFCGAPDLQPHHHALVLVICRMPGASQEEIAREICLDKSTASRSLCRLEESGYIKRERALGDKRNTLIYPTEKMIAVLPEIKRITKRWNELLSKDLSDEEIEIFETILSKIEHSAKKAVSEVRE